MASLYSYEAVERLADKYAERGGTVYTIPGSLIDNYIMVAPDCKVSICEERYLNEWSSACTLRMYNKMPANIEKIVELLDEGEDERAAAMFWRR